MIPTTTIPVSILSWLPVELPLPKVKKRMEMRLRIKNSGAVALRRIIAAKQVANKLCQISFVVKPSNHERPFDKLRTNGIVIFPEKDSGGM